MKQKIYYTNNKTNLFENKLDNLLEWEIINKYSDNFFSLIYDIWRIVHILKNLEDKDYIEMK